MTTNTLHFGLTYAGAPQRVLRARRAAWKVLRLLVLSALCGAAWSAGKAEEAVPHAQPLTKRERVEGIWIAGGLLLGLMTLVVLAVRKQGRERRGLGEAYAEEDPYAGHWGYGDGRVERLPEVTGLTGLTGVTAEVLSAAALASDPLALPAEGLTPEETARILKAVADELRLTRELVRGALRAFGVEDYGDALEGADRRLGLLRTTVLELRARFSEPRTANREPPTKEVPREHEA